MDIERKIDRVLTEYNFDRMSFDEAKQELLNLYIDNKCDCPPLIACEICGEEKNLDGDFWKNKKIEKLKINQRVKDEFLGEGTIVKIINGTDKKVFACIIKFDKTPPKDYNGGNNPCLRWSGNLSVL